MLRILKTIVTLFMLGSGAGEARAEVVRVVDGDGFRIGAREIRLWGIDAPELTQECRKRFGGSYRCGERSKRALGQILGDSVPICKTLYRDKHGREIARCSVRGEDVAGMMVRSGWALDYPRYSGGAYSVHQADAKRAGRGLWQGAFIEPWTWRKMLKG